MMRETILRIVSLANGITNSRLTQELMAEYGPISLDVERYKKILEDLVKAREIVRVTYVIPPTTNKKMYTGCLYLPERTAIFVQK